ncbi:MAG: response regulator transcription factor [Bryobacterales bacterium]|nr:response regulator transcription factor [Bryobacterales bacterium]
MIPAPNPQPSLRTVIVDDEPIARRVLAEELASIPGVTVIGEAGDGRTAVDLIHRLRPDLVLLDVQMPAFDGFEVARRLSPLPPSIVFVTAYDQHALRAFEVGAADYLLKPVRADRLRAAVEKAQHARRHPAQAAETVARTIGRRIVGRKGAEFFLLDLDDVYAFHADSETVTIVARQGRYLATHTLQELSARLDGAQFRRIHRNALVNIGRIQKLSALSSQRWLVTLDNGLELIVSKRHAAALREEFKG